MSRKTTKEGVRAGSCIAAARPELFVHAELWREVVALSGFAWSARESDGARDTAGDDVTYARGAETAPGRAGTTALAAAFQDIMVYCTAGAH